MTTEAIVVLVTAVITALGATKGRDQFNKWRFKRNGNDRRSQQAPVHCLLNPGVPDALKEEFRALRDVLKDTNKWSAETYRLLYAHIRAKGDFDLSMADKPKGD